MDYIQNELKPKLIGVHGTSLGGLVATYLANSKKVDFLCADRTFGSLLEVVRYSFGGFSRILFNIITDWNVDLSTNYFNSSSYKVLIYDPRDEIIHILSSLFYGSLKQMILKKTNFSLSRIAEIEKYAKYKWLKPLICVLFPAFQKLYDFKQMRKEENAVELYFHQSFLPENQLKNSTKLLKRVVELVLEVLKNQKNTNFRNKKEDFPAQQLNYDNFLGTELYEGVKKESFELNMFNGSLDEDVGKDYRNLLEDNDRNDDNFLHFAYEVSLFLKIKYYHYF